MNFEESEDKMLIEFLKGKIKRLEMEIERMSLNKENPLTLLPIAVTKPFFSKPVAKFMTIEGFRSYMIDKYGYTLSKSRIYVLCSQDQIPHIHGPGRRILFPIKEIQEWIDGGGSIEACQ
jgi:hypothetical protein